MLTDEEIKQFHMHGRVFRECKFMGKIPFVVRTFTVGDNVHFARMMDKLRPTDTDQRIKNLVAKTNLERCLVSFNGRRVSAEEVHRFSPPKCDYILEQWDQLCKDLLDYLGGYGEKPLDPEEIEEFILTDEIVRTERFEHDDEGVQPISFTFKVLSTGEHEAVQESLVFEPDMSRWHRDAIMERAYAMSLIENINGVEVDEETIDEFNAELVGVVMRRALKVEGQMREFLRDPEKVGEEVKN